MNFTRAASGRRTPALEAPDPTTPGYAPWRRGMMAAIQWGPWSGVVRGGPAGLPAKHAALPTSDLDTLQKTMLSMLTDPVLSDVCLVVEGVDVPCHKAVLAAWSRPFRAMFTLPMLESQHQCRVVIEDVEHRHLMVVLQYIYGGRIGLTDQNVMPVSALANRYEVLPLMAQCERYMKWRLKPTNVCQQLLAAEEHRAPKAVCQQLLEYLAVHFDEVHHDAMSDDFNSLGGDIVLSVLQHDGLTADEETIFLAVDGWAKSWERRHATRPPTPIFSNSVGRSPPPSVAEQAGQSSSGSSSTTSPSPTSHSVKKPLGGADSPPSDKASKGAQDARQERGGTAGHVGRKTLSGAAATVRARAAASAAIAAGEPAAARRRTEEERKAGGKPLTSATADAVGPEMSSHGGRADDTTGEPGSGDSCRSTSPAFTASALGASGVSRRGAHGQLPTAVVGEHCRKGASAAPGGTGREALQRRASVSAADEENRGGCMGRVVGRAASFSHPPPPPPAPESSSVAHSRGSPLAIDSSHDAGNEALKTTATTITSMPAEERAFVDELLMEIRFPLISTSFLCQVVEKSPTISDSRVAQRLLHEAYKFLAMTSEDAVDVDEHFPGNHRVKYRGHERVLFGEGDGCVGTVSDFSSSLSEVHLVENVKRKDEKYWLPGQPEEAYFCVRFDRVRRLTKVRFQNRYSEEFEVAVRRTRKEEWQVIVPRRVSGGHKDIQEIDLTRKRVNARHVKISLRGRKRSCYNTSCYWTELLGF